MQNDDWLIEQVSDDPVWGSALTSVSLNQELLDRAQAGTLEQRAIDVAMSLTTLVHAQYQEFSTSGKNSITENRDIALVQRVLVTVLSRLGITFDLPWRDYDRFKSYWLRNDGYGSWQARREILAGFFDPVFESLENRLQGGPGELAESVSPHSVTGWPRVDLEVAACGSVSGPHVRVRTTAMLVTVP